MRNTLYPHSVKIDGRSYLLIWCTDDPSGDHYFTIKDQLLIGGNKDDITSKLQEDAERVQWDSGDELDLDMAFSELEKMTQGPTTKVRQNVLILDSWNFFEDLIRTFSLEEKFSNYRTPLLNKAYDKLFWGCNLPSVTPAGKSYEPIWNEEEVQNIRNYMAALRKTFVSKIVQTKT